MQILIHFHDPAEQAALWDMLRNWMELSCVSINIAMWEGNTLSSPAIVFWDLDGPGHPPACEGMDSALFLCSRDPQRAIDSYSFHPTGFLSKPISMDNVWNAMLRCAHLWFSSLLRLEIRSGRVKIGVPFKNLIWAEGARKGCLIHTFHQSISVQEPLYRLEQHLPRAVFTRCQRSFVVNLTYVQEIAGSSLFLVDGTEISLGRGNKSSVLEDYRRFRRLRYGE